MNLNELNALVSAGQYRELHTSWTRGYVSRKIDGIVKPYAGKFGAGFALYTPSRDSSQYCRVTYYVSRR